MNRRAFLTSSSLTVTGLLLAACSQFKGLTPQQIASSVLTDAQGIANGLLGILPKLGSNVPANIVATLTAAAQDAAKAASDIVANMTQTAAQPLAARIESDVSVFVGDLATFVNADAKAILLDVQVVLPFLLTAVGLVLPAALPRAASSSDVAAARARLAALKH